MKAEVQIPRLHARGRAPLRREQRHGAHGDARLGEGEAPSRPAAGDAGLARCGNRTRDGEGPQRPVANGRVVPGGAGEVSAVSFTPRVRPQSVTPSVDAPALASADGALSPEIRGVVRRFQQKAIESAALVAVCTVLNVMETPETMWTLLIVPMLGLNLLLSGLHVWTDGISLRQMFAWQA